MLEQRYMDFVVLFYVMLAFVRYVKRSEDYAAFCHGARALCELRYVIRHAGNVTLCYVIHLFCGRCVLLKKSTSQFTDVSLCLFYSRITAA